MSARRLGLEFDLSLTVDEKFDVKSRVNQLCRKLNVFLLLDNFSFSSKILKPSDAIHLAFCRDEKEEEMSLFFLREMVAYSMALAATMSTFHQYTQLELVS